MQLLYIITLFLIEKFIPINLKKIVCTLWYLLLQLMFLWHFYGCRFHFFRNFTLFILTICIIVWLTNLRMLYSQNVGCRIPNKALHKILYSKNTLSVSFAFFLDFFFFPCIYNYVFFLRCNTLSHCYMGRIHNFNKGTWGDIDLWWGIKLRNT